jgi:hypothetical protein
MFQICWFVAGAILGFSVPQCVLACFKVNSSLGINVMFAFVGALTAYTLVR